MGTTDGDRTATPVLEYGREARPRRWLALRWVLALIAAFSAAFAVLFAIVIGWTAFDSSQATGDRVGGGVWAAIWLLLALVLVFVAWRTVDLDDEEVGAASAAAPERPAAEAAPTGRIAAKSGT